MMKLFRLMLTILFSAMLANCAVIGIFNIPQIEGTIVDAKSGEPIEGAVVVIRRGLKGGYEGGTVGYYKYQEAVTDSEGKYIVPSKGVVYTGKTFSENAPELIIFKMGYKAKFLNNTCVHTHEGYPKACKGRSDPLGIFEVNWYQDSVWNEETVLLDKFDGDQKSYKELLIKLKTAFWDYDSQRKEKCSWSGFETPNWLRAIRNAGKAYGWDTSIANELKQCPQWNQFIKDYQS